MTNFGAQPKPTQIGSTSAEIGETATLDVKPSLIITTQILYVK